MQHFEAVGDWRSSSVEIPARKHVMQHKGMEEEQTGKRNRNEAQNGNTNCTPSIGHAPPLRRQNVHRSTEIRPTRIEHKPLLRTPKTSKRSSETEPQRFSERLSQNRTAFRTNGVLKANRTSTWPTMVAAPKARNMSLVPTKTLRRDTHLSSRHLLI